MDLYSVLKRMFQTILLNLRII